MTKMSIIIYMNVFTITIAAVRGDEMKKKKLIWIISVTVALALIVGGCYIYVSDYYRADLGAIAVFSESIDVTETDLGGALAYGTGAEDTAFIFYPGGKVEYTAYVPLMKVLAQRGIMSIVVEMPFNLAVLDVNAADGIREQYPNVEHWYIGGHSLGGSMAASHLASDPDKYDGLVLLGAYSTADISASGISVISIFGSEDKVMNREKYDKYKPNLPSDFTEKIIDGGCHAYFGMYGEQAGDGTATVTAEEQINITSDLIFEYLREENADA